MEITDYRFIVHKVGTQECIFQISDESLGDEVQYFGYLSENGSWIIQQRTVATGAYRYYAGQSNYSANFVAREELAYVLFSELHTLLE